MIRQPAVADRFYPGNPTQLSEQISTLLPPKDSHLKRKALAAISPHAGYMYSGSVAAETLSAIEIPRTVLILGLNHHGQGAPVALSLATWQMPMGDVSVNRPVAEMLLDANSPIVHDELAHRHEHSVEVQIPFLQALQPDLSIIPIVLSHVSYPMCEEIAATIAGVINTVTEDILIVASSDMTHYESREAATVKDIQVLKLIEQLNPRGVYDIVHSKRISMCGIIPVTVALIAAKSLGATTAEVIRYTDSGEVSGDTSQVVGYAGVVIC
jgi:AmmeMemoRadiSam system protein B